MPFVNNLIYISLMSGIHRNNLRYLRYLQGTKGLMMTYRRSDSLHIVGYSDSDAGDDRKFTSRYVLTLAGGAILWKSLKQTVTTSSTMYAEFVACYEATGQVN